MRGQKGGDDRGEERGCRELCVCVYMVQGENVGEWESLFRNLALRTTLGVL